MKKFRYIDGVATIAIDREKCIGCGLCLQVCPHQVFLLSAGKAEFADRNGCMECGACARNCPVEALSLTPGVGCASLVIKKWLYRKGFPTRLSAGCC